MKFCKYSIGRLYKKASAIIHGFLLLISVLIIPTLLNKIPLVTAAVFIVGYKLAKPALFVTIYKQGWTIHTICCNCFRYYFYRSFSRIGLGLAVGIIVILIKSYQNSHFLHQLMVQKLKMTLAEEVLLLIKALF